MDNQLNNNSIINHKFNNNSQAQFLNINSTISLKTQLNKETLNQRCNHHFIDEVG